MLIRRKTVPLRDAQLVLKNHRGLYRNIGAPMTSHDAERVAYALSDGRKITNDLASVFSGPAFSCPGGTLYLLRTTIN
jgi:hypothetical protein